MPLSCRNLATEILIVGKRIQGLEYEEGTSYPLVGNEYAYGMNRRTTFDVTFSGSGKTIWSGTNLELMGPDSADYDLSERRPHAGMSSHCGTLTSSGVYPMTQVQAATTLTPVNVLLPTQGGVSYGFGDNMCTLRFGMQSTDEFYSGGVALQTISNPTITISRHGSSGSDANPSFAQLSFQVYVKYSNLVRIDSDTGAVTRTLDV